MTDGPYHSPKRPACWAIRSQALSDMLLMIGKDVEPEVVNRWTPDEQWLAHHYAVKSYLRASDNNVKVPPEPAHVAALPECRE